MNRYEAQYETYSPEEIEYEFRSIGHASRIFSGDEVPFSTEGSHASTPCSRSRVGNKTRQSSGRQQDAR